MEIDTNAYIENLSAFERLVVELVKAVVAGHYLVVLEDLSSFISVVEIKKLHKIIRYYAENGMSFLYVDAHFEEARQICDRTAIMKNSQIVKIFDADDLIPRSSLYRWSEGFDKHVSEQIEKKSIEAESKEIVFLANGLCYKGVKNLTFSVREGECLVLQDLNNHILSGLLEILSCEQQLEQGEIWIGQEKLTPKLRRKLAIIQEMPVQTMLFPEMNYLDNLCFTLDHRCPDVWRRRAIKRSLQMEYSELLGEEVFDLLVEELTQKQKYDLVYTRILLQKPKIVFCIQPFKRAELSLRVHVWELLERFLDSGISVVILAVNLADSLALADRLICIGKDNQIKEYSKEEFRDLPVDAPWLYLYQERDSF